MENRHQLKSLKIFFQDWMDIHVTLTLLQVYIVFGLETPRYLPHDKSATTSKIQVI